MDWDSEMWGKIPQAPNLESQDLIFFLKGQFDFAFKNDKDLSGLFLGDVKH